MSHDPKTSFNSRYKTASKGLIKIFIINLEQIRKHIANIVKEKGLKYLILTQKVMRFNINS